ncbi:hypothetical protein, partial [Pseudomonas aeruginosa]|uniref:hypothetical protein n=1 Tax=Pseudomonas aeruginosa TaxID=287 RepID=UPI00188B5AEB|nr:hypothetical protein [Pseudomonas aeruginosa]
MRNLALSDQCDRLLGAFLGHAAGDQGRQGFVVDGFLVGLVGFSGCCLALDPGLLVCLPLALCGSGFFGAPLCITLSLLGALLCFQLLALRLLGSESQFQFPALGGSLCLGFAASGGFAFFLGASFRCKALGLGCFAGNAFLALFLLASSSFGAQSLQFGLLGFIL